MRILCSCALVVVPLTATLRAQTPTPALLPTRHEIVRGTVTSNNRPLEGEDVITTRAPDRTFKSAKTDANAQRLGPVVTTACKSKPDRNPAFGADVGPSEQLTGGMIGKLPPDLAGDLSALAVTLPGVSQVPGGIAVFRHLRRLGFRALRDYALFGITRSSGFALLGECAGIEIDYRSRCRLLPPDTPSASPTRSARDVLGETVSIARKRCFTFAKRLGRRPSWSGTTNRSGCTSRRGENVTSPGATKTKPTGSRSR